MSEDTTQQASCQLVFAADDCVAALKPLVAAALADRHVECLRPHQCPDAWCRRGPSSAVVLVTPTSHVLFSASAAARYLLATQLSANVDVWLGWDSLVLQPAVQQWTVNASGETAVATLRAAVNKLEQAGRLPSPADYIVWSSLYPLWRRRPSWLVQSCVGVTAWLDQLADSSACRQALSRINETAGGDNNINNEPTETADTTQTTQTLDKFSQDQLTSALTDYMAGLDISPACDETDERRQQHPVLPVNDRRNVLITSALPYVNNVPHLGNIIGCVLSADVFARYCRLRRYQTLFICGTDEYGTATETRAIQEGLTPRQVCDKYHAVHADVYRWFNISFDHFGRTTTHHQTRIAQHMFKRIHDNGFTSEQTVEQLYCGACQRFLADRLVEGECPLCGYEDARGDQCDRCARLINAVELRRPRCKLCSHAPEVRTSRHVFLELPLLEAPLRAWFQRSSALWTANARVIGSTWLRDGLKARCITRDLRWGTPVPLERFANKVFYVWFDAPIGYLSITADYTDQWQQWWMAPGRVQCYQFMAKDNVPFHSVVFPACQLATGETYTQVTHLMATEYLNYEDGKFSKSRGVGVFGTDARDTGIASDLWRFYLVSVRPESQDSAFSWDDMMTRCNSELLNNLGNFVNRALTFCARSFDSLVPDMHAPVAADGTEEEQDQAAQHVDSMEQTLICQVNSELAVYTELMEKASLRDAMRSVLSVSRLGNQYMQASQPWLLVKSQLPLERRRAATVVALATNLAALLALLLRPFMPDTAAEIGRQLACGSLITPEGISPLSVPTGTCTTNAGQHRPRFVRLLPAGHRIGTPRPLFSKLEAQFINQLRVKYGTSPAASTAASTVASTAVSTEAACSTVKSPQVTATAGDPDTVQQLEQAVAAQAARVRQLKSAAPVDKKAVSDGVAELLQLKERLRVTQGAPEPDKNKGKSKKKK